MVSSWPNLLASYEYNVWSAMANLAVKEETLVPATNDEPGESGDWGHGRDCWIYHLNLPWPLNAPGTAGWTFAWWGLTWNWCEFLWTIHNASKWKLIIFPPGIDDEVLPVDMNLDVSGSYRLESEAITVMNNWALSYLCISCESNRSGSSTCRLYCIIISWFAGTSDGAFLNTLPLEIVAEAHILWARANSCVASVNGGYDGPFRMLKRSANSSRSLYHYPFIISLPLPIHNGISANVPLTN